MVLATRNSLPLDVIPICCCTGIGFAAAGYVLLVP